MNGTRYSALLPAPMRPADDPWRHLRKAAPHLDVDELGNFAKALFDDSPDLPVLGTGLMLGAIASTFGQHSEGREFMTQVATCIAAEPETLPDTARALLGRFRGSMISGVLSECHGLPQTSLEPLTDLLQSTRVAIAPLVRGLRPRTDTSQPGAVRPAEPRLADPDSVFGYQTHVAARAVRVMGDALSSMDFSSPDSHPGAIARERLWSVVDFRADHHDDSDAAALRSASLAGAARIIGNMSDDDRAEWLKLIHAGQDSLASHMQFSLTPVEHERFVRDFPKPLTGDVLGPL